MQYIIDAKGASIDRLRAGIKDNLQQSVFLHEAVSEIAGKTCPHDRWTVYIDGSEAILVRQRALSSSAGLLVGPPSTDIRVPLDKAVDLALRLYEWEKGLSALRQEEDRLYRARGDAGAWEIEPLKASLKALLAADPEDLEAEGVNRAVEERNIRNRIAQIESDVARIDSQLAEIAKAIADVEAMKPKP